MMKKRQKPNPKKQKKRKTEVELEEHECGVPLIIPRYLMLQEAMTMEKVRIYHAGYVSGMSHEENMKEAFPDGVPEEAT